MSTRSISRAFAAVALAALATACSGPKPAIGLVDVVRITQNWPKFQNYQNQLSADAYALERSNRSAAEKAKEQARLQARFVTAQNELTGEVTDAAKQVATQRGLKYVLTRQFVGYGGVDITPDVEKILKIEEKATPKP
jgi:Skp family chaperone for outer membrane proteins